MTSPARSRAARTHAGRTWTCPGCGLVCRGNGGQSSHRRACLDYKRDRLTRLAHVLRDIARGTWPRRAAARADLTEKYRHQYGLDYVRLRREIADATGQHDQHEALVDVDDLVLPHHRRRLALALHDRMADQGVTLPDAVRMTELVLDTVARVADGG